MPASFTSDSYTPDQLIANNANLLNGRRVTLTAGQNLARGAVVGKVSANDKYALSLSAGADGSEVPDAILAEDCDASAGDTSALVYFRGDFNERALTLGAGHTVDSIREGFRGKGIILISSIIA